MQSLVLQIGSSLGIPAEFLSADNTLRIFVGRLDRPIARPARPCKVTAKSDSEAEILLYDEIADFDSESWGTTSAKGLITKIKALGNVENITLRVNSVGGDVFEAQAMYSYLKGHSERITVRVDGLAASAASLVAMAGDKVIMPSNALIMIHNLSARSGQWFCVV